MMNFEDRFLSVIAVLRLMAESSEEVDIVTMQQAAFLAIELLKEMSCHRLCGQ